MRWASVLWDSDTWSEVPIGSPASLTTPTVAHHNGFLPGPLAQHAGLLPPEHFYTCSSLLRFTANIPSPPHGLFLGSCFLPSVIRVQDGGCPSYLTTSSARPSEAGTPLHAPHTKTMSWVLFSLPILLTGEKSDRWVKGGIDLPSRRLKHTEKEASFLTSKICSEERWTLVDQGFGKPVERLSPQGPTIGGYLTLCKWQGDLRVCLRWRLRGRPRMRRTKEIVS